MHTHNRARLFVASCLALTVTGMIFIIRGHIESQVIEIYDITHADYGFVSALAFAGFATSMAAVSPMIDFLGMRNLLYLAFAFHIGGLLAFIFAPTYSILAGSMFVAGMGNGLIEAIINPLCAAEYPEQKTHKLNVLHAWWPGGLIIGGLLALGMDMINLHWRVQMGIIILPTIVYGILIFGQKFPQTERVEAGVSTGDMFKEVIRPGFLLLMFCMMITAMMELAPNQWVESVLKDAAEMSGTMILVYGSGLMFILRQFVVGAVAKRVSPIGIMLFSVTVAACGLLLLSSVSGETTAGMAYVYATIFYVGVCYMWPTMLGIAAERYPKGGAMTINMMGIMGQFSVGLMIWRMGSVFDNMGPQATFRYVAMFAIFPFIVFAAMMVRHRMAGGYKAVRLEKQNQSEES